MLAAWDHCCVCRKSLQHSVFGAECVVVLTHAPWDCKHNACIWCCPASIHMSCCTQLINMYWSLLQLGRRLVLPSEFAAAPSVMAYEEVLQFRDPELGDGRLSVNLMFPATEGTVSRLMSTWWDVKVRGQPG